MNLRIKIIILVIGVMFSSICVNAQNKIKVPKLPKIPKFDFEFGNVFKMKPEEEKEALSKLDTNLKEQMQIIKNYNTSKYYSLLRDSQIRNMEFPFISNNNQSLRILDKKIFELEIKTEALVAKYNNANNSKKKKIKSELKQQLNKLFDEKEDLRKIKVKNLEEELNELRKSLRIRMQHKNEIIKRRMQELLNEDDYLEWD